MEALVIINPIVQLVLSGCKYEKKNYLRGDPIGVQGFDNIKTNDCHYIYHFCFILTVMKSSSYTVQMSQAVF